VKFSSYLFICIAVVLSLVEIRWKVLIRVVKDARVFNVFCLDWVMRVSSNKLVVLYVPWCMVLGLSMIVDLMMITNWLF